MGDHLTESDHERIAEFLSTPSYDRRPELLVPDEPEPGEDPGADTRDPGATPERGTAERIDTE